MSTEPSPDPHAELLCDLARKYAWWLTPKESLARPTLVLCQLLQLGTYEDVVKARAVLGDAALDAALLAAPPGVLDARSWNYWHRFFGRVPPPMPVRPVPP